MLLQECNAPLRFSANLGETFGFQNSGLANYAQLPRFRGVMWSPETANWLNKQREMLCRRSF